MPARAIVVLVLMAGCGAGEEQQARDTTPSPAAATPAPQAPAAETPPPQVEPPPAAAWQDCGRILSPLDRQPQRVEARTFDCRAARRVAVRYLRNRSLPDGWGPADCAASRAACEQGGWGFRIVAE